ncbi:MAG TPA: hypothetical protein VHK47_07615 [Polyangia bacterium]|jgi:hypothetical protein|nr:hypothetical protein [Polyangia bacterium]
MNRIKTLSLSLVLLSGTARAAAKEAPLPKPIKDMQCLVGRWAATGTMKMGAASANVKLTWDCRRSSGDFGVGCKGQITGIPGMAVYHEADLFGYDAGGNKYHWFSVTNGGETHDHVGAPPDGNKLQFVYNGVQDGKPFKEVIDMTFADDSKAFDLTSETFVDGKSASVLKSRAVKK